METPLQIVWRIVKMVLVALLLCAIAVLIWFGGGRRSAERYSTLLQILGSIAAGLGLVSLVGNLMLGGDLYYQIARTVTQTSSEERARQEGRERGRRDSFLVLMAGAGVLAILFGAWVQAALK